MISRTDWLAPLLIFVLATAPAGASAPVRADRQSAVCASGGMVVTACPIASRVGADILQMGGTAADAAVAVGFALAVTYPPAGNIGGGGFVLLRSRDGDCQFIDFRERAPAAASRNMYLDEKGEVIPDLSVYGHRAIGVPGSVAGLYSLYENHCTLPWEDLLAPAISLAAEGFVVSKTLAAYFERLEKHVSTYEGLSIFFRPDGEVVQEGDTLALPDLARTLRRIAEKGPDDFYRGETAQLISREMQRGRGLITLEDLGSYSARFREPVYGSYRGYTIISAPPPSSGGAVLLEILNIVEGYPLSEYGFLSLESVHIVTEAERRAYRDRAMYLGDPDYVNNHISTIISKDYADYLRSDIKFRASNSDSIGRLGVRHFESDETTHYSIMDSEGNVALSTTTLNGVFGSMVVVRGGGFLLNNEMDDFSVKPGVPNMYGLTGGDANAIEPGKRMLSSMTPTIVLDGDRPYLMLGTPGGSTIITTVAQIIMNIIDFGMDAEKAVHAPRFHHQWSPAEIEYERGAFSPELIEELEIRGHRCSERTKSIGDAQVILCADTLCCGVSDPRGGGGAESDTTSDTMTIEKGVVR
jgi:gamma-glutamyltranspeptidase/glutathione hydrolase